jgi:ankyrin repeat protein
MAEIIGVSRRVGERPLGRPYAIRKKRPRKARQAVRPDTCKTLEFSEFLAPKAYVLGLPDFLICPGSLVQAIMSKLSFIGAAERGRLDLVKEMLCSGTDVNSCNSRGHNALRGAVEGKHYETARYLLNHRADVDDESFMGWTALYLAVRNADIKMIELLLSKGADASTSVSPLYPAADAGRLDLVRLLLERGASAKFEEGEFNALKVAASRGNAEIVQLLLLAGANPLTPDFKGDSALAAAMRIEDRDMLLAMLPKVECLSANHFETLLKRAVNKDDFEVARAVLVHPNRMSDPFGLELLSEAFDRSNLRMVDLLLEHGANINARFADGVPLLKRSVREGPVRVRQIVARGADINARDNDGETPLHDAASTYDTLVSTILDLGADIEAKEATNGWTALHIAAAGIADAFSQIAVTITFSSGDADEEEEVKIEPSASKDSRSAEIVRVLLQRGANVNALDDSGTTPLGLSTNPTIAALLRANGAVG